MYDPSSSVSDHIHIRAHQHYLISPMPDVQDVRSAFTVCVFSTWCKIPALFIALFCRRQAWEANLNDKGRSVDSVQQFGKS